MRSSNPIPGSRVSFVRYSLPDMLREIQLERRNSAFAMEKLDQVEITKLFQKPRVRRAPKSTSP